MIQKQLLLAAFLLTGTAQLPAQDLKDWANFGRYQAENQETQQPQVVFMGNSITELWKTTDPDFFTRNRYAGRGISGQVSAQMLVRFRPDVIDLHPKAVVILAGTNDIALNDYAVTPEQTFGNILSMVELAEANGIQVVLCSVMPASAFGWRPGVQPAETIRALNAKLKAYAEKHQIPYVDYHSAMSDAEGGLPKQYSDDGVHPNAAGYQIMERLVQETLQKVLK